MHFFDLPILLNDFPLEKLTSTTGIALIKSNKSHNKAILFLKKYIVKIGGEVCY